jgi:hypothetical protein
LNSTKLLKEKCEKLETEKLFLQKAAEEQVTSLTRSYENQLQVTEWNNEQLDIRLTVKDAKLKLSQKNCKNMRKVLKKRKASVA